MEKKIKKLICIVGKSRSGKDTLAKELEKLGVKPLVTYTTRPKRDNETNGVEHWFVTKEEIHNIIKTKHVIAYTINDKTGVEYCAISDDIEEGSWVSYIINPNGLRYMIANTETDLNHLSDSGLFMHTVYLQCDEKELKNRGSGRNEPEGVYEKRVLSERQEFDDFFYNWKDLINGTIHTDKTDLGSYLCIAGKILSYANKAFRKYTETYVSKCYLVPKFKKGQTVLVKAVNGNKVCKVAKIKHIIDDGKRFSKPLYILDKYPYTVVQEKDIKSSKLLALFNKKR